MDKYVLMSEGMNAAMRQKDHATIRRLLEQGEAPDAEDEREWTLLSWAAWSGWLDIVCLMLDHGADINHIDSRGSFPLIEAVAAERADVVRLLIERQADVNLIQDDGTVDITIDTEPDDTALQMARLVGNTEITAMLLAAGALDDVSKTPAGQRVRQGRLARRTRQLELARQEYSSRSENKETLKGWAGAWATLEGWAVWVYHANGDVMYCFCEGVSEEGRLDDPGDGTLVYTWRNGEPHEYEYWSISEDGQRLSLHWGHSAIRLERL